MTVLVSAPNAQINGPLGGTGILQKDHVLVKYFGMIDNPARLSPPADDVDSPFWLLGLVFAFRLNMWTVSWSDATQRRFASLSK